jgi:membrane protease YdiL (CAAX protease family)
MVRFLGRLLIWRVHPGWYLLVLLAPPFLMTLAAWFGDGLEDWSYPFASTGAMLSALSFTFIVGPVEEFGWRGLMLPLLQQRYAPFTAGLVVGLVWAIWHIPAFLLSGTPQSGFDFLPFFVGTVSIAMIMTVMFNATSGSLLLPVLMHFQLNNPITPDGQPFDAIAFFLLAAGLVWWYRSSMFNRSGNTTVVPEG